MLGAMAQRSFSLADFYRRRVLRLLPALCAVPIFGAVAAVFTVPSEARQMGKQIVASALFASNLALGKRRATSTPAPRASGCCTCGRWVSKSSSKSSGRCCCCWRLGAGVGTQPSCCWA
jgi:hypothetical protein